MSATAVRLAAGLPGAERVRRAASTLVALARRSPVTVSIALLVLAVAIALAAQSASGTPRSGTGILHALATGHRQVLVEGRWWTLATWWIPSASWRQATIGILAVLVLGLLAEPRAPRWRLIAAALAAVVAGGGVGVLLQQLGLATGFEPLAQGSASALVDPISAGVAVASAASAWMRPIARRRMRTILLVGCLMPLVYVGHPIAILRLATAVAGVLAGLAIAGRERAGDERPWRRATAHERRFLLAATLALIGAGPIIGLFAAHRHTLAAPLTSLLDPGSSPAKFLNACSAWRITTECVAQQGVSGRITVQEALISALPWLLAFIAAWGVWRGMRAGAWLGAAFCLGVATLIGVYWFIVPRGDAWLIDPRITDATTTGTTIEMLIQLAFMVVLHLAVGIMLLRLRDACPTRPLPRRVRIAGLLLAVAVGGLALDYVWLGQSDPGAFDPQPSLVELLAALPERFLPPALLAHSSGAFEPVSDEAIALSSIMSPAVFALLVALGAWVMARGRRDEPRFGKRAVRAALRRGSVSSLSAMTLWPGYDAWRDPVTDALVPYRLERGVAIVLGGPIGAPGRDAAEICARFAVHADEVGRIPVVYSAPEALGGALELLGWHVLDVGEESVIDLATWSTSGKKRQDIRTSMNRAARESVEVTWTTFDELTVARAKELRALSEAWAGEKPLPEMGFTLGGYDELDDPDTLLGLAYDREGRLVAGTSWLPVWEEGALVGRTLDFMRRDDASMNGIMEMLIGHAANRFRDEGLRELSLSAAPLASSVAHADDDTSATERRAIDRLLAELGARLEPLYGFRSLLSFKRKFKPEQRPLVMAYPDELALPAIGLALTEAYLPGISLGQALRALRSARG